MNQELYKDMTLLIDGKQAFPEIINTINQAKDLIKINMFIWRDDKIGNEIANALLNAANRGVQVEISKDRYGLILEKCEECKKSFFHKNQTLIEKIKIKALEKFYRNYSIKESGLSSPLYTKLLNHPNIKIEKDKFKADHSKYYIIDDTLILGGINIEDKENGCDYKKRIYQDYMIKMKGKPYVDSFFHKLETGDNLTDNYFFGINLSNKKERLFEMKKLYLEMIKQAKNELIITMAYFSYLPEFAKEIENAYKRGVNIKIMIPNDANFQDDTNKRTIKKLLKRTHNGIKVYFSDKMIHTKMIINDNYISIGSTNITKKAFNQLQELNLFIKNIDSSFKKVLDNNIKENYKSAREVLNYKDIKYNKIKAKIENLLV